MFKYSSLRCPEFPLFSTMVVSFCMKRRLGYSKRSPRPRAPGHSPRLRLFPTRLHGTLGLFSSPSHFLGFSALRVAVTELLRPRTLTLLLAGAGGLLVSGRHGPAVVLCSGAEPPAVGTEAREGRRGCDALKRSVLASPFLGRGPDGIRGARESSERPAPKGRRGVSVSEQKRAQRCPLWVPDGTRVPWATQTAGSEGSHLRPRAWSHASVEEGQCPRHGAEASRRNQI